ncbi:DUF4304 domain-containing protein [Burkholderia contaminans]|uniref:DUF4304 domain-containing protein n=1 Tax=Burkholderia contaminans TaxID=488447 RepID=UPI001FC88E79|nr:DUF4304 domain-containing protein [Burkholderia contaminans]
MSKSDFALAVDEIQRQLRPALQSEGFKVRGRTFNRLSEDGCTHVVSIQMGPSSPPGTTFIPDLRDDLHGLFAVNLGVYVPEVARIQGGGEAKSWVQEYHCCVRMRLGALIGDGKEVWWHAQASEQMVSNILEALKKEGLPFIDRFATRDKILAEWNGQGSILSTGSPPRIVLAIILSTRGEFDEARRLLCIQVRETRNPGHPAHVRKLAMALGLGELDD